METISYSECNALTSLTDYSNICVSLWIIGPSSVVILLIFLYVHIRIDLNFILSFLKEGHHCTLCMKLDRKRIIVLPFNHKAHKACMAEWKSHSQNCPICHVNIFPILTTPQVSINVI